MEGQKLKPAFEGDDEAEVKGKIDRATSGTMTALSTLVSVYAMAMRPLGFIYRKSQALPLPLPPVAKAVLGLMLLPLAVPAALLLMPAPVIGKLRRAWRDRQRFADTLGPLALTISNLARWGEVGKSGPTPLLLTEQRPTIYFMGLMRKAGLLPALEFERVRDLEDVQRVLRRLEFRGWNGQLLVPSDIFNRFHKDISPSPAATRLMVV